MNRADTGSAEVKWIDRFRHWSSTHPASTGIAFAVAVLLVVLLFATGRNGPTVLTVVVAVLLCAMIGASIVGTQRRSPLMGKGLDVEQWSALRRAGRAARRGEPLHLDPPLRDRALADVRRQHRAVLAARWPLRILGALQLLSGVTLLWLQVYLGPDRYLWFSIGLCLPTGGLMLGLAVWAPRSTSRMTAALERDDDTRPR